MSKERIGFPNLAGHEDPDPIVRAELEAAGAEVTKLGITLRGEVKTTILGGANCRDGKAGWSFQRAWYYWVCKGPGLPRPISDALHAEFGKEVRVEGDALGPSPAEYSHGFSIGMYHVDTPRGLKALVEAIKSVTPEGGYMRHLMVARCDFCDRTTMETDADMIASPRPEGGNPVFARAHICADCVQVCVDTLEDMKAKRDAGGEAEKS